jgi:hypothetical protein
MHWSIARYGLDVDRESNRMARGDRCWMRWYGSLHDRLVHEGRAEVTRDITDEFRAKVGTEETVEIMQRPSFWRAGQPGGHSDWAAAWRSGIEINFSPDADGRVRRVTFRVM